MFYLGERSASVEEGKRLARELIGSGAALENFRRMTTLQGGNAVSFEDFKLLPTARNRLDVLSPASGYVTRIDCEKVGLASLVLGGGRNTKEDSINPAVGVMVHKKIGDKANRGEPLCTLYYDDDGQLSESKSLIMAGYTLSAGAEPERRPLVRKIIGRV
jgi:thymidine phosphorylase